MCYEKENHNHDNQLQHTAIVGFFEGEGEGSNVVGVSEGAGLGSGVVGVRVGSNVVGVSDGAGLGSAVTGAVEGVEVKTTSIDVGTPVGGKTVSVVTGFIVCSMEWAKSVVVRGARQFGKTPHVHVYLPFSSEIRSIHSFPHRTAQALQ